VREFYVRLDALIEEFTLSIRLIEGLTLVQYLNVLQGEFQFLLRDTFPKTLKEAHDFTSQIESNLNSYKFDVPPMESSLEQNITNLAQSHKAPMAKVNSLDGIYSLYQ
jgi:hypothetical protein